MVIKNQSPHSPSITTYIVNYVVGGDCIIYYYHNKY